MGGRFSSSNSKNATDEGVVETTHPPESISSEDPFEENIVQEPVTWYVVTDSSGYTKNTIQNGALHSAGKVIKAQEIGYRVWHNHDAIEIHLEADNIITCYRSATAAFLAGIDFLIAVANNNQLVSDDAYKINIGGIGIAKNKDVAYMLGENHADNSILITPDGSKEIQGLLNRISHGSRRISDPVNNIDGEIIEIPFNLLSFRNLRQSVTNMRQLLLANYDTQAFTNEDMIDQRIKATKNWQEGITTILFEICGQENNGTTTRKFKLLLDANKIHFVDESLCFAPNVDAAVEFAFALQAAFGKARFGIDYGKILVVDSEMRVGSCINVASKIGQDYADWGEVGLTNNAFAKMQFVEAYDFKPKQAIISGVDLDFYIVQQKNNYNFDKISSGEYNMLFHE